MELTGIRAGRVKRVNRPKFDLNTRFTRGTNFPVSSLRLGKKVIGFHKADLNWGRYFIFHCLKLAFFILYFVYLLRSIACRCDVVVRLVVSG